MAVDGEAAPAEHASSGDAPIVALLSESRWPPLVAILAASSVLGPEVDDGSIVYLLSKPVSRHGVALSKWVVAVAATLAAGALPLFVAALIAGQQVGGARRVQRARPPFQQRHSGKKTPSLHKPGGFASSSSAHSANS